MRKTRPRQSTSSAGAVAAHPQGLAKSDELPDAAPALANAGAAPELLKAIEVLEQAVRDLLDRNKEPRAAGVKSEMERAISGKFDHSAYGYGTFREFLQDAAAYGAVVVMDPPRKGIDTLVTLPGREVPVHESPPATRRRGRIRPDVWRAFTSWEKGYARPDWPSRIRQVTGSASSLA